jgi:hypothetical protein
MREFGRFFSILKGPRKALERAFPVAKGKHRVQVQALSAQDPPAIWHNKHNLKL